MATTHAQAPDDRDLIAALAFGGMAAQTLRAAQRLEVFELIGDTPRTAAATAADAGTAPQPTLRLLRALAALGLLREHAPGSFSATSAGALLSRRHPDSVASFVRVFTGSAVVRAWEHLDDSVRSGEPAFDAVFGTDFFSHLSQDTELSAEFNAAMGQAVREAAAALPHAYDFGRFTSVTDVGGGDGTLLAAVLTAHPGLTGTVFDTADGLAATPDTLRRHGLTGRCEPVAGDFFRSVPKGADVYLIKSVLHDWSDERAVTILRHCREVLPADGRVLIVEPVIPDSAAPDPGTYLSDLNMLVNLGGRERTRGDFADLCRAAGLSLTSVADLPGADPFRLIEAVPAD